MFGYYPAPNNSPNNRLENKPNKPEYSGKLTNFSGCDKAVVCLAYTNITI